LAPKKKENILIDYDPSAWSCLSLHLRFWPVFVSRSRGEDTKKEVKYIVVERAEKPQVQRMMGTGQNHDVRISNPLQIPPPNGELLKISVFKQSLWLDLQQLGELK